MPTADTATPSPAPSPAPGTEPAAPAAPSSRVRRLWRIGGALFAVGVLGFGVMNAVTQIAHEEHTELHEFPADGVRLIEVHSASGGVRIVGDAGGRGGDGTITVTARISEGLRSTGHDERVEGDRLVLDATCPLIFSSFCDVGYTVETPPGVDVLVRANDGATIEGIEGDVDVAVDQGGVELARIGGTVRADADQGSVRATGLRSSDVEAGSDQGAVFLRFLEAPRRVVADSDQGDVEVVVPEGPELYRLVTDTDQGTMSRDIRADPSSDRSISATTDQGDVLLRYP